MPDAAGNFKGISVPVCTRCWKKPCVCRDWERGADDAWWCRHCAHEIGCGHENWCPLDTDTIRTHPG